MENIINLERLNQRTRQLVSHIPIVADAQIDASILSDGAVYNFVTGLIEDSLANIVQPSLVVLDAEADLPLDGGEPGTFYLAPTNTTGMYSLFVFYGDQWREVGRMELDLTEIQNELERLETVKVDHDYLNERLENLALEFATEEDIDNDWDLIVNP